MINRVIRSAGPIDVHVISHETMPEERHATRRLPSARRRPRALTRERRLAGWGLAAVAIPLLTALLLPLDDEALTLPGEMLLYLLVVTATAVVGGAWPAITAAVVSSLVVNWFFTPPVQTWTIAEAGNVVALAVFVAVAATVSILVSALARRSADAVRSRTEAEAIATVAGAMLDAEDPLSAAVTHIRSTFGLVAVSVLRPHGDGWIVEASSGESPPTDPEGQVRLDLRDNAVLVIDGAALHSDDLRVMSAFLAQVDTALEHRRLRSDAADAAATAEGDRLRTAILRAVSHDLRTPLASIKASVTSLRQTDVEWSTHDRTEFLSTIEEETDRLNQLVGNLLDMSRLESGIVEARAACGRPGGRGPQGPHEPESGPGVERAGGGCGGDLRGASSGRRRRRTARAGDRQPDDERSDPRPTERDLARAHRGGSGRQPGRPPGDRPREGPPRP